MTKQDILECFKDINEVYNNPNKHDDLSKMLDMLAQQESCEDAISRQAVIDMLHDMMQMRMSGKEVCKAVYELPHAQLKPKTGTWRKDIDNSRRWDRVRFYCSECGGWQTYGETDFCPLCGAKMERKGK